ncbi:hypothetical protein ACHQM5_025693 [Ranunculus cassubicifolius]
MCKTQQVQVRLEEPNPQKWCLPLGEDTFDSFISRDGATVNKIFGEGSLFSPMLFGKFFDPSDAFPLWEFQSDILLSSLRKSGECTVEWFETEIEYALKAGLPIIPGVKKSSTSLEVIVEHGKVLEISGQWREDKGSSDWRSCRWWEFGYVRRLELPENGNWNKMDAKIGGDDDGVFLEIRFPKNLSHLSDV